VSARLFEPGMANGDAVTVSGGRDPGRGDVVLRRNRQPPVRKFNALGNACLGVGYALLHASRRLYDPGLAGTAEAQTMAISPDRHRQDLRDHELPAPRGVEEPSGARGCAALELAIVAASGTLDCRITAAEPMTLRLTLFDLTGRRGDVPHRRGVGGPARRPAWPARGMLRRSWMAAARPTKFHRPAIEQPPQRRGAGISHRPVQMPVHARKTSARTLLPAERAAVVEESGENGS
jgi:hypothetical protein